MSSPDPKIDLDATKSAVSTLAEEEQTQVKTDNRTGDFVLSVAAPVYNEQESIVEFVHRCQGVLRSMNCKYELVFINDGSKDRSLELLINEKKSDANIKIVNLSRNFGHQVAMSACIDHSSGDAVITLDADLQDPPELFPELVKKWQEGADVVLAQRRQRAGESPVRKWVAVTFYRFLKKMSDVELAVEVGDYRLLSRQAVNRLGQFKERRRYVRGLVSWLGMKQTFVPYDRDKRYAGVSKYPFWKLVRLALDGLSSFTLMPLRLAPLLGVGLTILSVLAGLYVMVMLLVLHTNVDGWAVATIFLSFINGIQLICIGIISEYLAVIHEETKRRPLYLVGDIL